MIVDSVLRVGISELSAREWKTLESRLTIPLPTGEVVQIFRKQLYTSEYILPRGAWALLPNRIRYQDNRVCPPMSALKFEGKLNAVELDPRYKGQSEAVAEMILQEQGLIVRPPGTGKTEIALAFAARARTRTLVVVHTEDILQQWIERIRQFVPEATIGVVRGQTREIGQITIATVQTLQKLLKQQAWFDQFGCVIFDEAHHVSARTWEAVANSCRAKYRFGFTASPTRADGLHPTMPLIVGPVIHRQKFSSPIPLKVIPVVTKFKCSYRGAFDWQPLLDTLVSDEERNKLIARKVAKDIAEGNTVLVLSRRVEHLENIAALIPHHTEILAAKTRTRKDRSRILQEFRNGELSCVLATQLADEALDVPRLNRVHLAHPGKHEGRIIQQIGRAIRKYPDKKDAVITDYVDSLVRPLRRQWDQRQSTYKTEKISIKRKPRKKIPKSPFGWGRPIIIEHLATESRASRRENHR